MMLRLWKRMAWVLVVLMVVFTGTLTEAQRRRSGGSAGGHHFGGSHSSSHSSGSRSTGRSSGFRSGGRSGGGIHFGGGSHSSGGGYEGEDYDPGYRPNGWYDRGDGWNGFLFLIVVIGGVGLWYGFRRKPRTSEGGLNSAWAQVDITQVRLVLSADARPFLQQKLLTLAESADTRSVEGLHRLLGQTARVLAMAESAWLYAGVVNHQPTDASIAQTTYERLAQDARAQFTDEVIRSANGALVTGDATGLRGDRARDGEGVIVVTFVVAAKRVISDVVQLEVEQLRLLLAELIRMPSDPLVGFEVSWMPAEPEDRMSTLAVESLFPTLTKLPGVVGGHRICAHCRGPHTAELRECPHCGAPTQP